MTTVVATLVACAAVDSLNPSVIGVTLYLLLAGRRGRTGVPVRVLTYVGTVAGTYFVIGVGIMLGLAAAAAQIEAAADHPVSHGLVALLGVGMLGWSFVDAHLEKTRPERRHSRRTRLPGSDRLVPLALLGVVVTVVEFATAAPYLAALGVMTAHDLPATRWLPLLAGYTVVMNLPPLLMLVAHRLFSTRVTPKLQRWSEKLDEKSRSTMHWVIGVIGVLLIRAGGGATLAELGVLTG